MPRQGVVLFGIIALASGLAVGASAPSATNTKIAVMPTQFDDSSRGQVPKLFDDYLLTAVQNTSRAEVIGQDDIAAMIGFDKQKELLGCDDASCIAEVGNALGADKIVVVKIARLGEEWVVTSKLINIHQTRVENRTSDMVTGNVKALLQAVPNVAAKLFGGTASVEQELSAMGGGQSHPVQPAPAPGGTTATASTHDGGATATTTSGGTAGYLTPPGGDTGDGRQPNPSLGRGARIGGMVTALSGMAISAGGLFYGYTFASMDSGDGLDVAGMSTAAVVGAGGLLVTGIGSGFYLNGKARAATGDEGASGKVWYRWAGWLVTGAALVLPFVTSALTEDPSTGIATAAACVVGGDLIFGLSMPSGSAYAIGSDGQEYPIAMLQLFRNGDQVTPGLGLAMQF